MLDYLWCNFLCGLSFAMHFFFLRLWLVHGLHIQFLVIPLDQTHRWHVHESLKARNHGCLFDEPTKISIANLDTSRLKICSTSISSSFNRGIEPAHILSIFMVHCNQGIAAYQAKPWDVAMFLGILTSRYAGWNHKWIIPRAGPCV